MLGSVALCALANGSFSGRALATEMGRAPVSSGVYVTLDGGYAYSDGASAIGHAISQTGAIADPSTETFVGAHDGYAIGGSVGYVAPADFAAALPVSRIEGYLSFSSTDESNTDNVSDPQRTTLKSVDGTALAIIGLTATSAQELRSTEGGVRFAYDQETGAALSLSFVLTPFIRHIDEQTSSVAIGTADTAWRDADVTTLAYGVTIAVEPEVWLTPTFALVGRLGAGVYGYTADGDFSSRSTAGGGGFDPFAASLSDDESGVGFRGELGAGLKLKLTETVTLTGYGEATYLSAVGSAELPDNQFVTATTSGVDTSDSWEFRGGARISVGLQ